MHNFFILQQYVCYITILNMFRAASRSSSGGQIVLLQPLVSSHSVNSSTVCRLRAYLKVQTFTNYQLNAQFLYSSTICMIHYDPQHVSSSTPLILRRTNCITTASGIVTLCKQQYSMQVESGLKSSVWNAKETLRKYPQIDPQQCSKYFKVISLENKLYDKSQSGRLECALCIKWSRCNDTVLVCPFIRMFVFRSY